MPTSDSAGETPDAKLEDRRAKRKIRIDAIAADVMAMRDAIRDQAPSMSPETRAQYVIAGMIALASADALDLLDDIDTRLLGIKQTLGSIENSGVGGR